jgi:type I restriction enzyme M protein
MKQTRLDSRRDEKTAPKDLGSIIKSVRDKMRQDKGLNGDIDRIPMITWIMFLKFLDDQENLLEAEAQLKDIKFQPTIEPPYRWRDWAAKEDGITGSELLAFINQDEAIRPDGTRGLGLFAYLRALSGSEGKGRRDVVATVFKGVTNRMINGYLLREVINKINGIHFGSTEEIHTLAFLYESLLKEMRDSAGDSGEFYTPRPVIKFMVEAIDPQLGETILDPAAGTGGFLVESFEHLKVQCKKSEDFEVLQKETLHGFEAKPMPFLLCQMNMLLHGIENPDIDPGNALRFPLREMGDKDRVDVVMTNPPFGGEEEPGIQGNFPEDKQTAETALLFLQLIMRKLRKPTGGKKGGRCGMVVPNGTLFDTGIAARIKKELLDSFNLHTIVRLPKGVFAPYTGIETNLLFFGRDGPTKEVWYYELPLPSDRQNMENPCYTKTRPLRYEEFDALQKWWGNREENEHAWRVEASKIAANEYNLDAKNPRSLEKDSDLSPKQLVDFILEKERRITEIAEQMKKSLDNPNE